MNRKHNPWVALVGLLLGIALVILCAGCTTNAAAATNAAPRFTSEHFRGSYVDCLIITDNETGVRYLYVDGYNAGGLCVLQDGEG